MWKRNRQKSTGNKGDTAHMLHCTAQRHCTYCYLLVANSFVLSQSQSHDGELVCHGKMRQHKSYFFNFSPSFSFFDHCFQFPTFSSVTWATNQVPGSWAAVRLRGLWTQWPLNTPQWINVRVCRILQSTVSYWYSEAAAAQCGACSQCYTQWDHSAFFDTPKTHTLQQYSMFR